MAKLQVAPELLVASLFNGAAPGVRIFGARFDHEKQVLEFDIDGDVVPAAERVKAICHVERFTVSFEPVT